MKKYLSYLGFWLIAIRIFNIFYLKVTSDGVIETRDDYVRVIEHGYVFEDGDYYFATLLICIFVALFFLLSKTIKNENKIAPLLTWGFVIALIIELSLYAFNLSKTIHLDDNDLDFIYKSVFAFGLISLLVFLHRIIFVTNCPHCKSWGSRIETTKKEYIAGGSYQYEGTESRPVHGTNGSYIGNVNIPVTRTATWSKHRYFYKCNKCHHEWNETK